MTRRLIPSDSHVVSGQPYAEVEVMKMVMPLLAPMPGVITFAVPEGAVLAGGDLIASLNLDDANAVGAAGRQERKRGGRRCLLFLLLKSKQTI